MRIYFARLGAVALAAAFISGASAVRAADPVTALCVPLPESTVGEQQCVIPPGSTVTECECPTGFVTVAQDLHYPSPPPRSSSN
jgi:hypothetical protein